MKNSNTTEKVLKVSNVPQGKGYVPGIKVSGKQLNLYGFHVDDIIIISYEDKKIVIEKVTTEDIFKRMCAKNHNLKSFAKKLDLVLA